MYKKNRKIVLKEKGKKSEVVNFLLHSGLEVEFIVNYGELTQERAFTSLALLDPDRTFVAHVQ